MGILEVNYEIKATCRFSSNSFSRNVLIYERSASRLLKLILPESLRNKRYSFLSFAP